MLSAAARVVGNHGYNGLTVARITAGANVSRRTFYEQFNSREECFLELFELAATRAETLARSAATAHKGWREQVRAGLSALLQFIEEEPAAGSLLVVDALNGGSRVLERRARRLEVVAAFLDTGRGPTAAAEGPPGLTAEGLVGAVLGVIHARLLDPSIVGKSANGSSSTAPARAGGLIALLNPLMGMIVLPYLGKGAAARELARPLPKALPTSSQASRTKPDSSADALEGLDMRLTYRTLRVLAAVATTPGASNREVADGAGVHDQGQISKLLARLERLGLVHNHGDGQPRGEPNAWMLTDRGAAIAGAVEAQQL